MSDATSGAGLDATLRDFSGGQKVFNRYTLIRTLGRGGMGIVWLAHDEVLDRDVALKFLPELIIHDRAVLEDLKKETKRSLELTHKNIVRIHDFVHDVVSGCISMEYIEGDTLSNLRADKPAKIFEPEEIKPWLSQLCDALDYAHNHARIIHRDLKPSNLMISRRGHVKVADFGIARSLSDSVSMLTQARGTSGTLVYMSPQQLDGERGTHLDDIYSLGATIYELLTSKPPFYSGNIDRQIREKIAPSMSQRRRDFEIEGKPIPKNWEETVAACLAKDPKRRPQLVAEVGERLQLTASPRRVRESVLKPTARKRIFLGLSALSAVMLICGASFFFWKQSRRAAEQLSGRSTFQTGAPPIPATEKIPPRPGSYFADYAGVISSNAASRFNEQLARFERETSNQVVVAIYRKMDGNADIDGYTRRIANAWGVGQASRNNGVVLFVFIDDKKMFLQVGEGLATALPNQKAFDITEHQIKPHLASNDFETGIREGINAICAATGASYRGNGKTVAESAKSRQAAKDHPLENSLGMATTTPKTDAAQTLGISELTTTEKPDSTTETNLTLRIGLKRRADAVVNDRKVKIQVYFYDTVDDKDIKLTDADVSYEWLTPNRNWKESDIEILAAKYVAPKNRTQAQGGRRRYFGYIVRLYYDDQLQDTRADPAKLLNLFPAAMSLTASAPAIASASPSNLTESPVNIIQKFVESLGENNPDTQLQFYSDKVAYYEMGNATKDTIRKDLQHDIQTWPSRVYSIHDTPKITQLPSGAYQANFQMTYTLTNAKGVSSGILEMSVRFQSEGRAWKISEIQKKPVVAQKAPEKSWDRPHIYLQVANESQRNAALALKERLQKSGYIIVGIQNVSGNEGIPQESSEVRFFTPSDSSEAQKIAKEVAPFFNKTGIFADLPEGMPHVSHARQYEIWFSSAFH